MGKQIAGILESLIHMARGKRVMLDSDLARLYGVPTKVLNQAVRRNRRRFPADFMFVLTRAEAQDWRSQIVTSNSGAKMGLRWAPHAFTEQGVAMLSSVLRSPRAIAANVAIMRAFVRYREALGLNRDLALKLKELEGRVDRHDGDIGSILDAMHGILAGPAENSKKIGFTP